MAERETIRALARGIEILQLVQDRRAAALNDLHKATGLPRPTILRVLHTLQESGLVWRGMSDGLWRTSYRLERLARPRDPSDRLAEIAAPTMRRLREKVAWPSDLIVPNADGGNFMEIRETSRPSTPFTVNRDKIGHTVNFPLSAVGRAYLAFCPDEEREAVLARLRRSPAAQDRVVRHRARFAAVLKEVRLRGYATRDSSFVGGNFAFGSVYDDRVDAIAVPLIGRDRVLGCINMVWFRGLFTAEEMAARHLHDLRNAAAEIAARHDAADL